MYYSEEDLKEIRDTKNIVDVVSRYTKLTKVGDIWMGLDPLHEEETPTFFVDEDKQMYYSFGTGTAGDIIDFLTEMYHCSTYDVLCKLSGKTPEYNDEVSPEKEKLLKINECALELFKETLKTSKKGQDYIKERELEDETVKKFQIGFANNSSTQIYSYLKKHGFSDGDIEESGLVGFYETSIADKFNDRLMFPIQNIDGNIIGFGGRITAKTKKNQAKYLNSPETAVFDKSCNLFGLNFAKDTDKDFFILCEGYMDVITMHQAGCTNAIASLGTAFTKKQAELLTRLKKKVVLSYDSDGPGLKAAERAMKILDPLDVEYKFLDLFPYKDPDEYIKAEGKESFIERVENPLDKHTWLYKKAELNEDVDFFIRNY